MNAETSDIVASIAGSLLHFGQVDLIEMLKDEEQQALLVTKVRALAASALRQKEPDDTTPIFETKREIVAIMEELLVHAFPPGIELVQKDEATLSLRDRVRGALSQLVTEPEGLRVNLIDVFETWGAREAKDTAMLIDLCLGAAIEKLVPFTVTDAAWPAQIEINGKDLERIAVEQRLVRLQPEPGIWRVRLLPPPEDSEAPQFPTDEWGKIGWIRRHLQAFADYHSYYETMSDSIGETPGSTAYHEERRKLGNALLTTLDELFHGKSDPMPTPVPGEAATTVEIAEGNKKPSRKR